MGTNGLSRIVHEVRDDCPASAHDTRRAHEAYGCRCSKAVEAERESRRSYFQNNADKLRKKARDRWRQRADAENPSRRRRSGRARYDEMEDLADWVIAQKIVREGPQPGASDADKWMAIEIMTGAGKFTLYRIAKQVGCDEKTVKRFWVWLEEKRGCRDYTNRQRVSP